MGSWAILNADTGEEKMTVEKQEAYLSNRRSCYGSFSFGHFLVPFARGTGHGSSQPEHQAILNADTGEEKMTVEKQEAYLSNRRSCHGSFSFGHFLVPFARGTGHGSSQPEHQAILNADTGEEKMTGEKQEAYLSNRRSCHGTKLLKSSFSFGHFLVPFARGTGHGSSQPEHQSHSEIYPSTLNVVSNCPIRGEYMQTSLTKCAEVCASFMQDGDCAYHCMRDSSKTKLVEFCAKPKPLFDFCPEYDPVDQTIQKDLATLCNSTSFRNYYNSSDIYFCDPNNCLQLDESSVRNGATTLTTLMNETTEINDGDGQELVLWPFVVSAAIILAAIMIGYILLHVFVKRGISSADTRKMTEKRNQNGKQYVDDEALITLG